MYDSESELYNLNARFYDAKLARFMQEDTFLGQVDDPLSLNLYAYCSNNPLKYVDPTGHSPSPNDTVYRFIDGYGWLPVVNSTGPVQIQDGDKIWVDGYGYTTVTNTGNTGSANSGGTGSGARAGTSGTAGGGNARGVTFGENEGADWLRTGSGLSFEEFWGVSTYGTEYYNGFTGTANSNTTNSTGSSEAGLWYQGSFTKQTDLIIAQSTSGLLLITPTAELSLQQLIPILSRSDAIFDTSLILGTLGTAIALLPPEVDGIPMFASPDLAAIHFANKYVLQSANEDREFYSYIYKTNANGKICYSYTVPEKLNENVGDLRSYSEFGLKNWDVVAVVHTHGRPNGTLIDVRFSNIDEHQNNFWEMDPSFLGGFGKQYTGLYLAAPNGTLQFLPARNPKSDNLIKIISTDTPVVAGALLYTPGQEQIYNAVVLKRPWTYYINPAHWDDPWEYTIYERKGVYDK